MVHDLPAGLKIECHLLMQQFRVRIDPLLAGPVWVAGLWTATLDSLRASVAGFKRVLTEGMDHDRGS